MFATDLAINSFTSDGVNLVVDFNIAYETTSSFNLAIYRTVDGVTQDQLLVSQSIAGGLGLGNHQVTLPASFSDVLKDYQLLVVLDSGADITESDEGNNQALFSGGLFLDANNVLQVHGTEYGDFISVYQDGLLKLDFNGVTYAYQEIEITGIAIRTHAGEDWVLADYNFTRDLVAFGGADNDVLLGGLGNDTFFGGSCSDYLIGGAGNDTLKGEEGDDYLSGDDGDDQLDGGAGVDMVYGGAGNDTLGDSASDSSYYGYGDILDAGEGDDIIYGTNGDDIIYGGAGNDTIYGLGGNDQLFGDDGDDYLDGGEGDDFLYGGAGSDTLYGREGYDSLFGEAGDDFLFGGSEDDYLVGGSDHDVHDTGGQTGDTVGDRPVFSSFTYRYRATEHKVQVSGTIIDDEPFTNLFVTYSGISQGQIALSAAGTFDGTIDVPDSTEGWLFLDFTDAEGLQAQRMIVSLT